MRGHCLPALRSRFGLHGSLSPCPAARRPVQRQSQTAHRLPAGPLTNSNLNSIRVAQMRICRPLNILPQKFRDLAIPFVSPAGSEFSRASCDHSGDPHQARSCRALSLSAGTHNTGTREAARRAKAVPCGPGESLRRFTPATRRLGLCCSMASAMASAGFPSLTIRRIGQSTVGSNPNCSSRVVRG